MSAPPQLEEQIAAQTGLPGTPALAAVQFLTRMAVPSFTYAPDTLARALVWFPLVGAALGGAAGLLVRGLTPHLGGPVGALIAVATLLAVTGALHEDGLADCADAFGLRHNRVRTLEILHDSRIGTFGAVALIVSIGLRVLVVAALPLDRVVPVLIAALTLSRWAVLPLAFLPPAPREDGSLPGLGGRIAGSMTPLRLAVGSLMAFAIAIATLRFAAIPAILLAGLGILLAARLFRSRLGGTTGDCFGATIQLVEVATLLVGLWRI